MLITTAFALSVLRELGYLLKQLEFHNNFFENLLVFCCNNWNCKISSLRTSWLYVDSNGITKSVLCKLTGYLLYYNIQAQFTEKDDGSSSLCKCPNTPIINNWTTHYSVRYKVSVPSVDRELPNCLFVLTAVQ